MTTVKGRVAFPDRKSWRGFPSPQPGETWEVEIAGENPRGTVYFLRPIRSPKALEAERQKAECREAEAERQIIGFLGDERLYGYFLSILDAPYAVTACLVEEKWAEAKAEALAMQERQVQRKAEQVARSTPREVVAYPAVRGIVNICTDWKRPCHDARVSHPLVPLDLLMFCQSARSVPSGTRHEYVEVVPDVQGDIGNTPNDAWRDLPGRLFVHHDKRDELLELIASIELPSV